MAPLQDREERKRSNNRTQKPCRMVQEERALQDSVVEKEPGSYGTDEGASQEEEDKENAFHSLRHVKRFAKEACRALDAAEAAIDGPQPCPKIAAALRRYDLT